MRKNFLKKNSHLIIIFGIAIIVILAYNKKEGFQMYRCPASHPRKTTTTNLPLCWNGPIPAGQRPYLKVRFYSNNLVNNGYRSYYAGIENLTDNTASLIQIFNSRHSYGTNFYGNPMSREEYKANISDMIRLYITPSALNLAGNKNLPFRNLPNISNMPANYRPNYENIVWGFLATTNGIESSTFVPFAPGTTATNIKRSLDNGQITDIYIAYAAPSNYILKLFDSRPGVLANYQLFPAIPNYSSSFAIFPK
jgi:hypothetical protein